MTTKNSARRDMPCQYHHPGLLDLAEVSQVQLNYAVAANQRLLSVFQQRQLAEIAHFEARLVS